MSEITSRNSPQGFFFLSCFFSALPILFSSHTNIHNYKRNIFALLPFFISWTQWSDFFYGGKKAWFFSNTVKTLEVHHLCMEVIWLLIMACGMLVHTTSLAVQSRWILAGTATRGHIQRPRASPTCSMGDRFGEYASHVRTRILSARLCKPIGWTAIRVAGLRWVWRWRCWV